jgi:hypothetical protein
MNNRKTHSDINDLSAFDYEVVPMPLEVRDPMNPGEFCNNAMHKQVLVRKGSEGVASTIVGVHSEKYKPQSTFQILENYNAVLNDNIDCSDVTVTDKVLDGGRKARRSIVFNNYQFEVTEGEKIALKLDLFNSFDGSWPWFSAFGALNFVCMNGLVSGQFAMVISKKHTTGFAISSEIAKIKNAATMFNSDIEKFKKWTQKKVSWVQVEDVIKKTLALKPKSFKQKALNEPQTHSEPVLEYVMRESARLCSNGAQSYKSAKEPSVWDVYNAATHWSTHNQELRLKKVDPSSRKSALDWEMGGIRKTASAHNVNRDRELKVAQMLISQPWQQMVA